MAKRLSALPFQSTMLFSPFSLPFSLFHTVVLAILEIYTFSTCLGPNHAPEAKHHCDQRVSIDQLVINKSIPPITLVKVTKQEPPPHPQSNTGQIIISIKLGRFSLLRMRSWVNKIIWLNQKLQPSKIKGPEWLWWPNKVFFSLIEEACSW